MVHKLVLLLLFSIVSFFASADSQETPPLDLLPIIPARALHLELSSSLPIPHVQPVETLLPLDQKLFNTFKKAVKECKLDESIVDDFSPQFGMEPLEAFFETCERQGIRPSMEDTLFHCRIKGGFLWGIFDGHADDGKISAMASEEFQRELPRLLKERPLELKRNLKEICASIHKKVTAPSGGTTAVVCYLDRSNRLVTASVGDSRVIVIRKIGDRFVWAPATREKNWCHSKEAERVEEIFDNLVLFTLWSAEKDPKRRYFPLEGPRVNVSRSVGDKNILFKKNPSDEGRSAISQVPDVTLLQLQEGDLVIAGCDGVFDFCSPDELIAQVIQHHWGKPGLAQAIADYILKVKGGTDNVSDICTYIRYPLEKSIEQNPPPPIQDLHQMWRALTQSKHQ